MNLQIGISQWDFPALGDSSNNQASSYQEIDSHRPVPSHNTQNLELTTSLKDFVRYSLTLGDILRIVATKQARARNDRPKDVLSMIFVMIRQLLNSTNRSDTPNYGRSQSLNRVPQIVMSPSDGSANIEFLSMDSGATSSDGV